MPNADFKSQRGAAPVVTVGDVQVSASLNEVHELIADVTSAPVEGKIDNDDHIYRKPREVSIDGVVSDVFLEVGFPGKSLIESFRTGNEDNPSVEAWHTIKSYWETSKIVDVETSLETIPSVGILSFRVQRGPGNKKGVLYFSIKCRQINVVSTQTTNAIELPQPKDNVVKGKAEGKGSKGKNDGTQAQDTKAKQSTLSRLAGGVSGFLGF
jgi:hypothetical protein